ncbi:MAG: hypothetical protein H8E98_04045 [Bacteroidetes bacterium]|nr:hypothetical protein [Bacteroidota bacterium]
MPIDKKIIKEKLERISQSARRRKIVWKPEAGDQYIRIVPYKTNPSFPFIELYFHYGFMGKNILSPTTFDEPDPLVEYANKLRESGDKKDYENARKLTPKMRVYAPVLVRGSEEEGVKFWGFNKTIYEEFLGILNDPVWGDITDPAEGRDVKVTFIPAKNKDSFPKTTIVVQPNTTPISTDRAIISEVKNQAPISDAYTTPSYDEMVDLLNEYLEVTPTETSDEDEDPVVEEPKSTKKDYDDLPFEKKEVPEKKEPSKQAGSSIDKLKDDLDNLFPEEE